MKPQEPKFPRLIIEFRPLKDEAWFENIHLAPISPGRVERSMFTALRSLNKMIRDAAMADRAGKIIPDKSAKELDDETA